MVSLSDISVKLRANVQQFKSQMRDAQRSIENVKQKGQRMGRGMKTAGKAVSAAGAGMAAGLGAAANEAVKFEDAMAQVQKVSSAKVAKKMEGRIRDLTETIPMAQSKLAEIAADAARFGVEGSKNIENFTETTAKMANATTLNANQAGQAFAKLAEMTNTPISEIKNMGSMINELSNNFATSSQEIVDSMMRASGVLSQAGLGAKTISGLSASLNAVSESSERAGTRLRRLGQEALQSTGKKTKQLAKALKDDLAGESTQQLVASFKKLRKKNPKKALMLMAKQMKEGGKSADTLRNALSTVSRQALAGLGQNLQGVKESIGMANDSFEKATSLQREFAIQSDTAAAKFGKLKNRLRNAAITIGNRVLPHLLTLSDALSKALDWFNNLSPQVQDTIAKIATFGTLAALIVGPILFLVGTLATMGIAFSTLVASIVAVTGVLAGLTTAFTKLSNDSQQAKNTMGTLKQAFQQVRTGAQQAQAVFNNQIRPALQRVLAAARKAARQFNTHLRPALVQFGGVAVKILRKVVNRIATLARQAIALGKRFGVFEKARAVLARIIPVVAKVVQGITKLIRRHQGLIAEIITLIGTAIAIVQALSGVVTAAGALYGALGTVATILPWLGGLLLTLLTPLGLIVGAVALVAAAFATDFMGIRTKTLKVVNAVVGFFKYLHRQAVALYNGLRAAFTQAVNAVVGFYNGVKRAFNQLVTAAKNLHTRIRAAFNRMVQAGLNLYQKYKWVVSLIIGALLTLVTFGLWPLWKNNVLGFRTKVTKALRMVAQAFRDLKTWVSNALAAAAKFINKWATRIGKYVGAIVQQIRTKFRKLAAKIRTELNKAAQVVNRWVQRVRKFFAGLAQKARKAIAKFVQAIRKKLAPLARFYDQKIKQPLLDLISQATKWGRNLVNSFIQGITKFLGKLASKVVKLAKTVEDYIGIYSPARKGPLSNLHKWGPNLVRTFAQGILNTVGKLVTAGKRLVTRFVNAIKLGIKNGVNTIITTARSKFNALQRTAVTAFNSLKKKLLKRVAQIRKQVLKRFNQLRKRAVKLFNKLRARVLRSINRLRAKAQAYFARIVTAVTRKVTVLRTKALAQIIRLRMKAVQLFKKLRDIVVRVITSFTQRVLRGWQRMYNVTVRTVTRIYNRATALFKQLKNTVVRLIVTFTQRVLQGWQRMYNVTVRTVTRIYNRATALFTQLKNTVVRLVVTFVKRVLRGWQRMYNVTVRTVTRIYNKAAALFTRLKNTVVRVVTGLINRALTLWTNLKNRVVRLVTNLKNRAVRLFTNLKNRAVRLFMNLKNQAVGRAKKLKQQVETKIQNLKNRAEALVSNLKRNFVNTMNNLKNRARDKAQELYSKVESKISQIDNISDKAWEWGNSIIDELTSGIRSGIDDVKDAAGSVASAVDNHMPGSDADTGPLSNLTDYGPDLVATFARGIAKNAREAGRAAQSVAASVRQGLPDEGELRAGMPGVGSAITADVMPHGSIPVEGVEPDQEVLRVEEGAVQIRSGAFQGVAEEELPQRVRSEVEREIDQIIDQMRSRGR